MTQALVAPAEQAVRRGGGGLARSVLGAGLVLLPPLAVGRAGGGGAVAAWTAHLLVGASFSCVIGLLALRRTGAGSIAEVTGRILGGWAERTIHACYLAGFTVGQAAIAVTAARLVCAAFADRVEHTATALLAAGLLTAAAVGAIGGVRFGDRGRAVRLAATAVLAVVGCAWPVLSRTAGLMAVGVSSRPGSLVFLLFFAGVGWEAGARIAPTLPDRRTLVWAVLVGAGVVGGCYLALTWLVAVRSAQASPPAVVLRLTALATAAVLLAYCVGNVVAAAGFVTALRRGPGGSVQAPAGPALPARRPAAGPEAAMAAVALVAALVAVAACARGWSVALLLVPPCCAAWIAYLLATAAAIRSGAVSRLPGGLMLLLLLLTPLAALV